MYGLGKILYDKSGTRLLLRFRWSLRFGVGECQKCDTVETLRGYLGPANIWLCGHKQLVDWDILELVFGIVNPHGKLADPIDRYVAKETGILCDRCETKVSVSKDVEGEEEKFSCHVYVRKCLGRGESAADPVWVAQCGT